MATKNFFLFLFILISLFSQGFSQQIFSKTYGHFDYNYGKDILPWNNGYVILGNSGANNGNAVPMLIQIDTAGNIQKVGFGQNSNNEIISASKFAYHDNQWYVTGTIQNTNTNDYDCFLSIFDTTLTQLKTTIYGGSSWDFARGIAISDTNVFIVGNTYSTPNGYSWGTITQFNLEGDSIHNFYFGSDGEAQINNLIIRGDTELVFTGDYQHPDSIFRAAFVASTTFIGSQNWNNNFSADLFKSCGNGITSNINNRIVCCGVTERYDTTSMKDGFICIIGSNGDYISYRIFNVQANKDDEFMSITSTNEGNVFITGTSKSFGMGDNDISFYKLDSDGSWKWSTTFGQVYDDLSSKIIYSPSDSGFVFCGSSGYFGNFNNNILVVRTTNALTLNYTPTHQIGIEQYNADNTLHVFPNPAQNQLTIQKEGSSESMKVDIYDLNGRTISSHRFTNSSSNTIDLSDIAPQLLIVKVTKENGVSVFKIMKK